MAVVTKTIMVKIFEPTKVKIKALDDLLDISANLLRFYIEVMEQKNTYSKKTLHEETYNTIKEKFAGIPTGLIQAIRDKAVEAYKSYKAILKKNKRASLPKFKKSVVRFDRRTFILHKTDTSFTYFVSLSTRQKRILIPIKYRIFQAKVLDEIFLGKYKFCSAELSYSKRLNCYVLNISYKYQVKEIESLNVMGIDIGLKNYAVLAVPEQLVKFFGGKRHNQKRMHYSNLRRILGKKKLLKKIKAIGSKERRYMKDINHKISRQIVNIAKEQKAVIRLEDLSNIRERIKFSRSENKRLHNWNFYQLQTLIEYKAIAEGLKVEYVTPKYTSRKCHVCGHTEKGNRPRQTTFKCRACGYEANADYNASINIARHTVAS